MRLRRGAKIRREIQAQAEAALLVVKQHAEAGRQAQNGNGEMPKNDMQWAPPQMWSQSWPPPNVAAATPQPPPPAVPAPSRADPSTDLLRILDTVTRLCERVMDALDEDRAERRLMVEALTRLTDALPVRPSIVELPTVEPSREHVIGGSMPAGPEPEIDLRDNDRAVEVRCRFGDNWVDGFEICEVISAELGVQYRLRRRVDGVVLPELFDAADIRHVETFEELSATPAQQRYWSPL